MCASWLVVDVTARAAILRKHKSKTKFIYAHAKYHDAIAVTIIIINTTSALEDEIRVYLITATREEGDDIAFVVVAIE